VKIFPFVLTLALTISSWADSPLTSSEIWTAYQDVPEVMTAHDIERLNTKLAYYLLSSAPLDKKAAVVNALSWNFNGKQNAPLFLEVAGLKYKTADPDQIKARLKPDERFCLGYLMALDNYFEVKPALLTLRQARRQLPNSFTVAIVTELVEAQHNFAAQKLWQYVEPVFADQHLRQDLRPKARKVIYDYMALYRK